MTSLQVEATHGDRMAIFWWRRWHEASWWGRDRGDDLGLALEG